MAGNLFLQIEGVTGECVENNHKGWIDVESYSEGLHSNQSTGYGGGGSVGSVSYEDFSINCQLEKAIPNLMAGCAGNKSYPTAKLHAIKMSGDSSWIYLEITMKEVMVTGVHFNGSTNQIPHVQVGLSFSKIKTEYWMQDSKGGRGSSTVAEWDVKANKRA